ncbi:hypothetical protein [Nitrospira sp. Nam80]
MKTEALKKRMEALLKRINSRIRRNEIKAANQRLREEIKAYRHKTDEAVSGNPISSPLSQPEAA